jgi:hypothetical protein
MMRFLRENFGPASLESAEKLYNDRQLLHEKLPIPYTIFNTHFYRM